MTTKSLGHAISLWGQSKSVRSTRLVGFLKTAFKIYVLPNLGYKFISQLSAGEFSDFCYEVEIDDLEQEKILVVFDQAFDACIKAGKVSTNTKRNYRSAIGKFFSWLKAQSWYLEQTKLVKPQVYPGKVSACKLPEKIYVDNYFYSLKPEELTPEIHLDIKRYEEFWSRNSYTTDFANFDSEQIATTVSELRMQRLKQAEEEARIDSCLATPVFNKLSKTTLRQRKEFILRFLGWCVNIEGYEIKDLSLDLLTRQAFYQDYITWLIKQRNCGSSIGRHVLEVSLSIAKYKTFTNSHTIDWSDIPLVQFLKSRMNFFEDLEKKEQLIIQEKKWSQKEISHQQAREIVEYLYQTCAFKNRNTYKHYKYLVNRNLSAVVNSWQSYLMIKILVYAPIRQEELRKLRIGKTLILVNDSQGLERYAVKIKEHKNSHRTGKIRYYPLPQILTKDISTWINEIRPLAIKAPETIDSWLAFWGYTQTSIFNCEEKIKRCEIEKTQNQKYIESAKTRLKGRHNRVKAYSIAKENAEKCEHLFFSLGSSQPNSFCSPFENRSSGILSRKISKIMANATLALFGEAKFLNPHGFRNIGAKHLRSIGKNKDKKAFSALLGHTVEIDDDYAEVITKDYELIECAVDEWWK
ncbi:hypothetical protein H6G27_29630 [Nostoc linckia FACHB-104]|nr:hypothetical protein [Nostoc linckia FACHB-104]